MKKTKPIQFYVSEHEHSIIEQKATELDLGMSQFIRNAIQEKIFNLDNPQNAVYVADSIEHMNFGELEDFEQSIVSAIKKRKEDIIFSNTKLVTEEELEEAGIVFDDNTEEQIRNNLQKRGGIK
jgi:MFS superfamily sulfate permease-like transporter